MFKHMKLLKLSLILLVFATLVGGCKIGGKVKVGLLIPAREGYRWIIDEAHIREACEKNGMELVVRSAENDENLQLKQGEELIEEGVDVLILVSVNANTAGAIVRDAHEADIPVIGYDRLVKNSDLDYYITFEGEKIGSMMLEQALAKKPQGNYVFLFGDPGDNNAIFIKNAQEAMIEPHAKNGSINIVYKAFVEDWNRANAKHVMNKVLSHSTLPIDAIITSYDGLGMGAIDALKEAGYSEEQISNIVITGQDAELEAVQAINNGLYSHTVYKSIPLISSNAVEMVARIAAGKKVAGINGTVNNGRIDVPSVLLTPVVVDKNSLSVLINDKFYTREQIEGKK
jgi:D-xylose transport system substrate-binding protein